MSSSRTFAWMKTMLAAALMASAGCSSFSGGSGGGHGGATTVLTGQGGSGGGSQGGSGGATGTGGTPATGGSGGTTDMTDGGSDDACLVDTDLDGTPDCMDGCPNDYNKTKPLVCGCNMSEVDSDNDGVPDCMDKCPGVPDVDSDGDGVLDCMDGCPKDKMRTTPGTCGCGGIPDTTPFCLVHRYGFSDTGTTITDAITIPNISPPNISPANGTAMNVTSPGTGSIVLQGGTTDQYVALPAGIISSMGNSATFEAWVTWTGGAAWQRIMDFGNSDAAGGMGQGNNGLTYLFVTPLNSATQTLRAALSIASIGGEAQVTGPAALPTTGQTFVAVVIDGTTKFMTLYLNGTSLGQIALGASTLSGLNDLNNWLGRSQFLPDPEFAGSINEFRIYSSARTAVQVMGDNAAGPDAPPAP